MIANRRSPIRARFVRRTFAGLNVRRASCANGVAFWGGANDMPPHSYRHDPSVSPFADDKPIIIFDGYCALCSGWASFVLRHDHTGAHRLLSAQSPLGRALYVHYGLDPQDYETNPQRDRQLVEGDHLILSGAADVLGRVRDSGP